MNINCSLVKIRPTFFLCVGGKKWSGTLPTEFLPPALWWMCNCEVLASYIASDFSHHSWSASCMLSLEVSNMLCIFPIISC